MRFRSILGSATSIKTAGAGGRYRGADSAPGTEATPTARDSSRAVGTSVTRSGMTCPLRRPGAGVAAARPDRR